MKKITLTLAFFLLAIISNSLMASFAVRLETEASEAGRLQATGSHEIFGLIKIDPHRL